jgi:hypothetical protein
MLVNLNGKNNFFYILIQIIPQQVQSNHKKEGGRRFQRFSPGNHFKCNFNES